MAEPLLVVENLCIDFRTRGGLVRAVDQLNFTVGACEIVALVGESGSGKTISMLATLGLITDPNAIISGRILFRGQDLRALSPRAMRQLRGRDIAMIFQDPMSAMTPVHAVGWQISEQIRAHEKISARAAKDRAIDLLAQMGVPNAAAQYHRYPHQLSGGLRQRAMIAMALSCSPSLLIADEPTTALDVTVQAQILKLLVQLKTEFNSSIVLITHDMGVVAEAAERMMVMYAGTLVESGPVRDVFAQPAHPYSYGLLTAIPPLEGPRLARLPTIPGSPPSLSAMPPGCAFAPRCAWQFAACRQTPPHVTKGSQIVACHLAREASA